MYTQCLLFIMKKNVSCHQDMSWSIFYDSYIDHFKLGNMYRQKILAIFVLFIVVISIAAYSAKNEKICSQNFMINGTNLVTNYRKQVLVIGVTHLGCQACRNQAIKYDWIYKRMSKKFWSFSSNILFLYNFLFQSNKLILIKYLDLFYIRIWPFYLL